MKPAHRSKKLSSGHLKILAQSVEHSIAQLHGKYQNLHSTAHGLIEKDQLSRVLTSMVAAWAPRSADPRLDDLVARAYFCIHYDLRPLAAEILQAVRGVYEKVGVVTHSGSRRAGGGGPPGMRKEFQKSLCLSETVRGERARCAPSSVGVLGER